MDRVLLVPPAAIVPAAQPQEPSASRLDTPEISVVVPAYGGLATIGLCLASVQAAATDWSHEILVVESSGDGAAELVREQFPQAQVIVSETRLSAGEARNIGIRHARGRYLFCVDQDCLVPVDWLNRLMGHFQHAGVGAAGGAMAVANPGNLSGWCVYFLEFLNHFPRRYQPLNRHNFLIGANSAWRQEVFRKVSFPDQTLGEDRLLSEEVRRLGLEVVYDASIAVRHYNRRGWAEFLRYVRAMARAAASDQRRLGGRCFRLIDRLPLLSFALPMVILPLIGWRLLAAPPGYLLRFLLLLPACIVGQLLWAMEFRAELLAGRPALSRLS